MDLFAVPIGLKLPLLWWYLFYWGREPCVGFGIDRPVFDVRARRVFAKIVVTFPVFRWTDWPGKKASAAVGADIFQDGLDASGAECALISTDASLK
jgi:hypothetical protein